MAGTVSDLGAFPTPILLRGRMRILPLRQSFPCWLVNQQIIFNRELSEFLKLFLYEGGLIRMAQIARDRAQFFLKLQPGFVFHRLLNGLFPNLGDFIGQFGRGGNAFPPHNVRL